jgi:hypothetical protein
LVVFIADAVNKSDLKIYTMNKFNSRKVFVSQDTDIGQLWSNHFPSRKIDAASRMFCLSISHAIGNIAQNNRCGGVADALRSAVRSLEVPEDEFFQFTEETKAR